jgi:hypothetical protein
MLLEFRHAAVAPKLTATKLKTAALSPGDVAPAVRARISRCKIKKKLAHQTRFERVTFAFGGQG